MNRQSPISKVVNFFTSARFLLPLLVTISTTLVTFLIIFLMQQITQKEVEEMVLQIQKTALVAVTSDTNYFFQSLIDTTLECAKIVSSMSIPPATLNSSQQSLFPTYASLYFSLREVMSENKEIISFVFQWPSARMFGWNVGVYFDVHDNVADFWLDNGDGPDYKARPSLSTSRDSFTSDVVYQDRAKQFYTELVHSQSLFSAAVSVRTTVLDSASGVFAGYLTAKSLITTVRDSVRAALPTTQSIAFGFDTNQQVLFRTSTESTYKVVYASSNYSVETVLHAEGFELWSNHLPNAIDTTKYFEIMNKGTRWFVGTTYIDNGGATMYISMMIPEDDVLGRVQRSTRTTIYLCSVLSSACIVLIFSGMIGLGTTLTTLQESLRNVAFMGLHDEAQSGKIIIEGRSFFTELRAAQESYMNLYLAVKAFHYYVPINVARGILIGSIHNKLGMNLNFLVVSFQDIESFTSMCEQLRGDPDRIIEIVSPMIEEVSQLLMKYGGTIDKYIGDCIMTYWELGDMNPSRHAACRKALQCAQDSLGIEPEPGVRFRTGVNCGMALLGNFGSGHRFNYTCVGDAVNVASRIGSLNKTMCSNSLCAEDVVKYINESPVNSSDELLLQHTRYVGKTLLIGKDEPIGIYEIMKTPFSLDHRRAWEHLIRIQLEKQHDFDMVLRELNSMFIPDDVSDATVEYMRDQIQTLKNSKDSESQTETYKGYWIQRSK
eukprot:PhF_6_TR38740/c0_g2_i1/m.57993/K01768/E4.6.1.1; adenylate cyclase